MRIIALDPGNEQTALCELVDGKPRQAFKIPNAELLGRLRAREFGRPEVFAVEMIASYGMAVGKEVFDTCLWIGRFIEAHESHGCAVRLVYRKEVKLFLCETNRANDANIRAALIDRYGPGKDKAIGKKATPGPLFGFKGDEWAALAVAVTAESDWIKGFLPAKHPDIKVLVRAPLDRGELPF
jgi:hypothetical protein